MSDHANANHRDLCYSIEIPMYPDLGTVVDDEDDEDDEEEEDAPERSVRGETRRARLHVKIIDDSAPVH